MGGAHACPQYCEDTCECEPCGLCASSAASRGRCRQDGFCGGSDRCTSCRLNREETAAERAEREERQRRAIAARKAAHPAWPGPRQLRTDKVLMPARLVAAAAANAANASAAQSARAAEVAARLVRERRVVGGGGRLGADAALAREAQQLLHSAIGRPPQEGAAESARLTAA